MVRDNARRRVVVEHTSGPRMGLKEIVGPVTELLREYKCLPPRIPKVEFGGHTCDLLLALSGDSYVLYREHPATVEVDDGA